MAQALLVGAGGFIGSILRYWLSGLAHLWVPGTFPIGTLCVNTSGCFAIGAIWSLVEYGEWFRPETRVFLVTGILGGFTTFSAFGYETSALLRDRQYLVAGANICANVLLGISAVVIGWLAARTLAV